MKQDWEYLTKMTGDRPFTIERVAIEGRELAIEGHFELPPLAQLRAEDQVFVAVFVKCHGSIKQMEKQFGISYPTVKGWLNRIGTQLGFVDVETCTDRAEVLDQLDRGDITVEEAIESLSLGEGNA